LKIFPVMQVEANTSLENGDQSDRESEIKERAWCSLAFAAVILLALFTIGAILLYFGANGIIKYEQMRLQTPIQNCNKKAPCETAFPISTLMPTDKEEFYSSSQLMLLFGHLLLHISLAIPLWIFISKRYEEEFPIFQAILLETLIILQQLQASCAWSLSEKGCTLTFYSYRFIFFFPLICIAVYFFRKLIFKHDDSWCASLAHNLLIVYLLFGLPIFLILICIESYHVYDEAIDSNTCFRMSWCHRFTQLYTIIYALEVCTISVCFFANGSLRFHCISSENKNRRNFEDATRSTGDEEILQTTITEYMMEANYGIEVEAASQVSSGNKIGNGDDILTRSPGNSSMCTVNLGSSMTQV